MRCHELMLVSIWLLLLAAVMILGDIRDQLEDARIVHLVRESSGGAAAVSAAHLPDTGGDK